jgi:hypothetical protein
MTTEHAWRIVVTDGSIAFATCLKCGLARVKTLTGEFYFVQWAKPFLQCSSPYRTEPVE